MTFKHIIYRFKSAAHLLPIAFCCVTPAHAQDWGRWHSGAHEFAEQAAWVSQVTDGELVTMGVVCAAETRYVTFNLDSILGTDRVEMVTFRIGSQVFEGEARYRSTVPEPAWAIIASPELIDALKSGDAVEISAGRQSQIFSLQGSGRAIDEALDGCGMGRGYHRTWTTFFQFAIFDAFGNPTYDDRPAIARELDQVHRISENTAGAAPAKDANGPEIKGGVEPMQFSSWGNGGNCYETCSWIAAEGEITDATPAEFERYIADRVPASIMYINSTGGHLIHALALGRRLRELGISTAIGITVPDDGSAVIASTAPGSCLSACAYMFLGGLSRSLNGFGMSAHSFEGLKNDRDRVLGFHGVSLVPEQLIGAMQYDLLETAASGAELAAEGTRLYGMAEFSSGLIVEYLTEMGIDARLLQAAIKSGDGVDRLDMKFPPNERLSAFGVLPSQDEGFESFQLQIVGDGLVATTTRKWIGGRQDQRTTLRIVRVCDAPTPWIVYSTGLDSEDASDLSAVMADPAHQMFDIKVGDLPSPDGRRVHGTAYFSRTNDQTQVHRRTIEAFGGEANQFGDLSMPSFASSDAFTVFLPLADDWRSLVGNGGSLEWSIDPRINSVPKLIYTFDEDDLKIAERISEDCLSYGELALIRY